MWSTWATTTGNVPTARNVTGVDQRAQANRLGVTPQPGERGPGVGVGGQTGGRTHLEVVVGAEEGVKPTFLGGTSHRQQLLVGGPLLGFGEDSQSHARTVVPSGQSAVKRRSSQSAVSSMAPAKGPPRWTRLPSGVRVPGALRTAPRSCRVASMQKFAPWRRPTLQAPAVGVGGQRAAETGVRQPRQTDPLHPARRTPGPRATGT